MEGELGVGTGEARVGERKRTPRGAEMGVGMVAETQKGIPEEKMIGIDFFHLLLLYAFQVLGHRQEGVGNPEGRKQRIPIYLCMYMWRCTRCCCCCCCYIQVCVQEAHI